MPTRTRNTLFALVIWAGLAVMLLFLALPVAAILTASSPSTLLASLETGEALDALLLSFQCSLTALALIVLIGTPAAWLLATRSFPGSRAATTLIELPLVLPPAVAGLALLAAFGPIGLLGGALEASGMQLVLTTAGVVVALVFVSAPFYIRQAQEAFRAIDPELIEAARTLGADEALTVARVAVPTAFGALAAGAALAWARALGEFGATLMFAGSLRGITQTAPLAIYDLFGVNLESAEALAAVLTAISGSLLLSAKFLGGRRGGA